VLLELRRMVGVGPSSRILGMLLLPAWWAELLEEELRSRFGVGPSSRILGMLLLLLLFSRAFESGLRSTTQELKFSSAFEGGAKYPAFGVGCRFGSQSFSSPSQPGSISASGSSLLFLGSWDQVYDNTYFWTTP
jgi:hypothetical protein